MTKLDERRIFTCPWLWTKIFVTRMLTRDLFAVDNLLVRFRFVFSFLLLLPAID